MNRLYENSASNFKYLTIPSVLCPLAYVLTDLVRYSQHNHKLPCLFAWCLYRLM